MSGEYKNWGWGGRGGVGGEGGGGYLINETVVPGEDDGHLLGDYEKVEIGHTEACTGYPLLRAPSGGNTSQEFDLKSPRYIFTSTSMKKGRSSNLGGETTRNGGDYNLGNESHTVQNTREFGSEIQGVQ